MEKKKESMDEDILAKVLETEKEIADMVKAEREKTARWLEGEIRGIEAEKEAQGRRLEESLRVNVDAAREKAVKKASAMVEDAAELRRVLSELDDKVLKRIVEEHIGRILPGRDHDSQDVES
jgi:hypothetical protein